MIEIITNSLFPFVIFTLDKKDHLFFKKITKQVELNIERGNNLVSAKSTLAGQIEKEYYLDSVHDQKIANILKPAIEAFNSSYSYLNDLTINSKNRPLIIDRPWINFQKKYEYNPVHYHGGLLSFVIWVKVPYKIEEEKRTPNSLGSNSQTNGCFYFLNPGIMPTNTTGVQQTKIEADKTFEGKGVLFPSNMLHGVYPFYTSEKYRVSISGNFLIDVN